ncbi:Coactosin-like protein [Oopsacas minuta]|uniref:Coactosin-like protein n=1 Tax=Oopsacas minuta TaxID=111878 RepID=A0AAV7JNH1_9METZ|nr:Coactosin-like protein [Oopsacas minuta]
MASQQSIIPDIKAVRDAYEAVRDDANEIQWLVLHYDDKSIELKCTGKDYDEMISKFVEDERNFAYIRMTTGDDMSVRAKFVFITWIGLKVSHLKKAKVSTDKAFVKEIVKEYSVEILADDRDDLKKEAVLSKVELSSGARY